jgi:demethylphylloquinone reductase
VTTLTKLSKPMNQTNQPTLILGGGFVGLFTALHLSRQKYPRPIILIEQHDRFSFKPLLYELLSGELRPPQVYPRYGDLLIDSGITFVQSTVKAIDLLQQRVDLTCGNAYHYRQLVLALGSTTAYFNIPGAAQYALPLTSGAEALSLRQHLRSQLMSAIQTPNAAQRREQLTVAIIGAGPAGIELACTLGDLLPLWYEDIGGDGDEIRVVLVNRSGELLRGDINSRLRCSVKRSLRQRGVELLFDAAVTEVLPDRVNYQKGATTGCLKVGTIVWTAGIAPNPLLTDLAIDPKHRDRRGRLMVLPTLQLPGFSEVFAAGDGATATADPQPPTAQVAYQQGKAIAQNLQAIAEGRSPTPVTIHLRGTLMKLGLNEGVANLFNKLEIKGQPGHLIREATYLELLPTIRYNAKVTADWLGDELLQRHRPFPLSRLGQTHWLSGMATVAAGLILALPLTWRAAEPTQFHQALNWTGVPTLLDQLTPTKP